MQGAEEDKNEGGGDYILMVSHLIVRLSRVLIKSQIRNRPVVTDSRVGGSVRFVGIRHKCNKQQKQHRNQEDDDHTKFGI